MASKTWGRPPADRQKEAWSYCREETRDLGGRSSPLEPPEEHTAGSHLITVLCGPEKGPS